MDTNADLLFAYLRDLIYAPHQAQLDLTQLGEAFRELGEGLLFFGQMVQETRDFAASLAKGDLDVEVPGRQNELAAPMKSLHASLRHMTWQTQQVAQGDYKQRLEFLGDFAEAFNTMTRQLDQRQQALMEEIENGKQKTQALEQSIDLLETLTAAIPQWLLVVPRDDGREALFVNDAAKRALARDPVFTKSLWDWVFQEVAGSSAEAEETREVTLDAGGEAVYLSVVLHPIVWRGRSAVALVITDVSTEKHKLEKLENVAYRDNLTRVYSRHYGMKRLHDLLREHVPFALCFIDIDHLKYINDEFGHPAGDEYIQQVAEHLRAFPGGMLARLGGDEFMVLAPDCPLHEAEQELGAIRAKLAKAPQPKGSRFRYSISFGVLEVDTDNARTASELLSLVDQRMYAYKRAHKQRA